LVSIMSTTGARDLPPPTPAAMQALLQAPARTRQEASDQAVAAWRVIGGPGFPFDEKRIRERAERQWDRCHHPPGVMRQLVAIQASGSRREALRSVRAPALVIHGEDDPLVPVECGRDTLASIPGARGLFIPGMGHDLPVELYPTLVGAIAEHAAAHPVADAS
jgi:pimeloyl-ACP methyl ester carboxylesterase